MWDRNRNRCGIGWVLRNDQGKVLWMGARKLPMLRSSLEVEMEALRWAVLRISCFSYDNIIFETDSQGTLNALNEDGDWPAYASFNHDTRQLLSHFRHYKVLLEHCESALSRGDFRRFPCPTPFAPPLFLFRPAIPFPTPFAPPLFDYAGNISALYLALYP
ncbi:unnamed protein product [Microthlaspi erraticum]|uniref:RNase H type-1 domain-containing protein n=1 Tax=Microthlaspi erraticum TaxID=1685480 RepID=A0A6D2INV8_9BRAS|nr:unnamed protein product [Microthlaspi erraticum]